MQNRQRADQDFIRGCEWHAAGKLAEAERCYRAVLETQPTHVDALSNLAVILKGSGRAADAIKLYGTATKLAPEKPHLYSNLANAFSALGRHEEAVSAYLTAIKLSPDPLKLQVPYARELHFCGRSDEALAQLRQLLAREPNGFDAIDLIGLILLDRGDFQDAIRYLSRAVELKPDSAPTLNNLGCALLQAGRHREAKERLENALRIAPRQHQSYVALGDVFLHLGNVDAALPLYQRAVELGSSSSDAWFKLGSAQHILGRADAGQSFQKVLSLNPNHLGALNWYLGHAGKCGDFEAVRLYHASLRDQLEKEVSASKDWPTLANCAYAAIFNPLPDEMLVVVAGRIDQLVADTVKREELPRIVQTNRREDRLRIGYLSPNFRDHPVGHVTTSLFRAHSRTRFEVHGFSTAFRADDPDYTPQIRAGFDEFHVVGRRPAREAAEAIRLAGIDILVDLDGFMDCSSLPILAMRPAPIQAFWLGHAGGLGLSSIDYLIADHNVVPLGEEAKYREKVIRLAGVYHCADTPPLATVAPTRAECSLPATGFVFCAFNNPQKIMATTFDAWMRILGRVSGACLWLSNPYGREELVRNFRHRAEQSGIDPARLVFANRVAAKTVHLARHRHAGLFLDSVGSLSASTTALDAIWAGLPLLTVQGDRFASRIATTFLRSLALDELVCANLADYEARAAAIGNNPEEALRLAEMVRSAKVERPLFRIEQFARGLEAAYERIWSLHRAGSPPMGFAL